MEDGDEQFPREEARSPPEAFREQANLRTDPRQRFADEWPDAWAEAAELLDWVEPYTAVLNGDAPPFRWFPDGRINACYNCLDRHLPERKNQVAIHWEGRLDETRTDTYLDLYREVNAFAAALRELGVDEDDVVTLYLPVVPELVVAMLACARIGAPHNVVFAGLSADALATRMARADSSFLVTSDSYYRRRNAIDQKRRADAAMMELDHGVTCVVVERLGTARLRESQYDYADLVATYRGAEVDPVPRASRAPLFRIYTSGTTGEPKAVAHTTGSYLAHVAWTARTVLDIKSYDTYWCTADLGWITGHSYIVYGPLALGATTVLYEGTADDPEKDRVWDIIERNAVDVFYTSPTAIRTFMKWGDAYPADHDLSSLRLLGSVGEPIDPRAWRWYHEHVGGGDCPIVDTWWQTETGAILVSTLPAVDAMKPGSAGKALPGIDVDVRDVDGRRCDPGEHGTLAVTKPWPGMPRELADGTDWGADAARGDDWVYRVGDEAVRDSEGYLTLLGRADDVIAVGDTRFGTMEIESAIIGVPGVAEAAVISSRDADGPHIYAYVTPEGGHSGDADLRDRLQAAVADRIGEVAQPREVIFTPELPKTRSGKIMRRLLVAIANRDDYGDLSALRNPEVVGELQSQREE